MSGTRRCKHGEALDSSSALSTAAAAPLAATTVGGRDAAVYNTLTSVQQFGIVSTQCCWASKHAAVTVCSAGILYTVLSHSGMAV